VNKLYRRLILAAIYLAALAPLIPQVMWSFAFRWNFPDLWPSQWSLKAWRYLLSPSSRVGEGLLTSLEIALAVCALSILVGLPAARGLALYQFRGKALIDWLLMLPIIVPNLVVVMGIHMLFITCRLNDSFLGVVLVHLIPCIPYMVLVMASVFANYGVELEDTARTLGAGPWRIFWHITLPAIFPGLLVATLFTFLISWSQYITTVLIGGGRIVTLPMALFPFISSSSEANAAAVSLVFVAPAILVLILTSRQLGREAAVMGGFSRL
jgi:putative spermidine/putrescine transport system permease protein